MKHDRNPRLLLILAALLTLLSGFALAKPPISAAAPYQAATRTPVRFATRTPTPTRTPVTSSLKKALYWGGLGGSGNDLYCDEAMLNRLGGRPGILTYGRVDLDPEMRYPRPPEFVAVCIFGLPFDQGLGIELYRPDGRWGGMSEYYLGGENHEIDGWDLLPVDRERNPDNALAAYINQVPVIQLLLWVPDGLPQGEWYASLQGGGQNLTGRFSLPPWQPAPMVSVDRPPRYRFTDAMPLGNMSSDYITGQKFKDVLTTGNKLVLYGAGFRPGSVTGIGAYQAAPDSYCYLTNQIQARANAKGEWSVVYTLGKNDPPGAYNLAVVLDPNTEAGNFAGPSIYYTVEEWRPCPNTYASLLQRGQRAQVIPGQKSNRLRSGPTRTADNITGLIPDGQPFDILDGPRCADGWIWWYVRTGDGQTGWTAEGDGNQRWLEPVP